MEDFLRTQFPQLSEDSLAKLAEELMVQAKVRAAELEEDDKFLALIPADVRFLARLCEGVMSEHNVYKAWGYDIDKRKESFPQKAVLAQFRERCLVKVQWTGSDLKEFLQLGGDRHLALQVGAMLFPTLELKMANNGRASEIERLKAHLFGKAPIAKKQQRGLQLENEMLADLLKR